MAKLSHNDSRRMYSWWWDSHISPKNSKWLQENLTDMDAKVKSMIKLIEEDADSFARRAEMYYKKRPELMKMVEDFYRAYRALAERYDHATGVIRQAHKTMSEACPDFPMMFGDDSPASTVSGTDLRTPDMSQLDRDFTNDSESVTKRKSGFGSVERVRRGLNFDGTEEDEHGNEKNGHARDRKLSESDKESGESEEIVKLKEAIAKLEAEKEAGLVQYQQSLDKLSQLESEISKSREDFEALTRYAKKADDEVSVLKDSLSKAEAERESNLHEYQQCLETISDLQKCKEIADAAESEVDSLKGEVDKLSSDKEAALSQYMQSLETISNLENKLRMSEEEARCLKERAEKADSEIETLNQTISKLTQEKEASALLYQQCLEKISTLELKLACAEEEAKKLNEEIHNSSSKLKGVEEQCLMLERSNQSLHTELESLTLKMGTQTEELTEKQKELGRLWTCVQEERLRFVEAETAFQTLQRLHAQTQEELRATAFELQNRVQLLKSVETQKQALEDEVLKVKEENKNLDELNVSSALSIKDMRNEISSLVESKGKLEQEVEVRIDERNALQQEIYCLREELNDLRKNHESILDQVHFVGLSPETLGSSVKELREENSNLRETCQRETSEKAALLEKLVILDKLLEKNSALETSLSDLNTELESVRGKIEALEQSCRTLSQEKSTLLEEKAALTKQLEEVNTNLEKLSANNSSLVNSLSDTQHQLEALTAKSRILEDSCQLLVNEKAGLVSENDGLSSQLKMTRTSLEDLEKLYGELEGRCLDLENEKESTLRKVEELQMNLNMERKEHASYVQMSKACLSGVEAKIHLLQEECLCKSVEVDQMLVNAVNYEIELFVLSQTSQEMKGNYCSLLQKNLNLLEESALSERKISQLEKNGFEQEAEIKSLSVQVDRLRAGNGKLLEVLDIVEDRKCKDRAEQDQLHAKFLVNKLHDMKEVLVKFEEESLLKTVDCSVLVTWIKQLKLDLQDIETEKNKLECDVKEKNDRVSELQNEAHNLLVMNEELNSKLKEGGLHKDELMNQINDLNRKLLDMQEKCNILEKGNLEAAREKRSLEEKNDSLSYENDVLSDKVFDLENSSLIFRSCADENFTVLKQLEENAEQLRDTNAALLGKLSFTEGKLQESELGNIHLKETLQKLENEFSTVLAAKDHVELKLKETEDKLRLEGEEKLHLKKILEDLTMELGGLKLVRDQHEGQIDKLSADNEQINSELKTKINEINELETEASSIFGQLQYILVSHLLYEQKSHELRDQCLGYIDESEALKTQLAAYGPEIASLKECIMSLENHTDIHIKFQNPQDQDNKATTDSRESVPRDDNKAPIPSSFIELHDLRVRLEAIVKSAIEIKEQMLQENSNLQSKLDASTRQLELLHRGHHHVGPASEITEEAGNAMLLLTKDIVLDQVSDGSSYGFSKRDHHLDSDDQIIELWDSRDLEGKKSKKVVSPRNNKSGSEFRRVRSLKNKRRGDSNSDVVVAIEKDLSVDKLEISKRSTDLQETNKRKVLERLDSDVQKLANLQITVRDLKRILQVTEKGKRGKAVIECEAMKGQLEEADVAVMKLFDLNARLIKNIEDDRASSFDLDRDENPKTKRVLEQARRMSEKIGRLQMEIQKLQFVLLKMDDENKGKSKLSESSRRVLLRDYLYGGGRGRTTGERRKKTHFCACMQPSTIED